VVRDTGGGGTEKGRFLLCAGKESGSHLLLKYPKTQRWRKEVVNNEWPHISDEIALGKIFTAKRPTEQRNLGTLTYEIKYKWDKQAKKIRNEVGRRERIDCI
jgi:hypothetical protein